MSEFDPILLTLPSLTPSLALEILPSGLTLHRLFVQADGRTHDIVIGPESPQDHTLQRYINTVVGRYSNRLPVGTHKVERNGISSEVTAILNEGERVSLHGGPTGFDALPWKLLTPDDPPTLFSAKELAHIPLTSAPSSHAVFRLVSADGDQGFPGKLVTEVLVALIEPGEQDRKYRKPGDTAENEEYDLGSVVFVYRAKLDEGNKKIVTPVNLTQHWGFNLEGSQREHQGGAEPLSVKEHKLTIKSDRIVKRDADSLPTGFTPSAGTPHAHDAKLIGDQYPEKGYDDYYVFTPFEKVPTRIPLASFNEIDFVRDVLRPSNGPNAARGNRSAPVVELESGKSGLKLVFDTNQGGVMFYSFAWTDPQKGARKKIHGGSGLQNNGDSYGPGTAAFLEFHDPLAAFLDPANKDKEDTLLTSDEVYHNYVRLDVKFKEPAKKE
ncbi:galactose mutarotase-like domain-containing protein [Mycena albidolilacea]|uniref:Galactose mutarotase-like domain-containing protein n=1 Tax=Mycena albidolilacea TaxID=1033008 RepID=A0AAD7ENG8_9AGAR|nr:galactose mutarotase-like domain-containing protein [Mycena albidolilacea]